MKITEREYNPVQDKATYVIIADNESEITANAYPECAVGSQILVISTGVVYIKNTAGKWQKYGTTEVI
jgi:hypothetical protein